MESARPRQTAARAYGSRNPQNALRWGLPPRDDFLRQFRAAPNLLTLLRLFIVPFLVIEILDSRYRLAFALFIWPASPTASTACSPACSPSAPPRPLSRPHRRQAPAQHPLPRPHPHGPRPAVRHRARLQPRPRHPPHLHPALRHQHPARLPPQPLGKLNTLVQILGLTVVLVHQVWPAARPSAAAPGLLRAIAFLAPLSAAQYAWIVLRRISTAEREAAIRSTIESLIYSASGLQLTAVNRLTLSLCRVCQPLPPGFFAQNVRELRRVEHLAACLAFHKLDVVLAGDDANLWMFARCRHRGSVCAWKDLPLPNPLVNRRISADSANETPIRPRNAPPQALLPSIARLATQPAPAVH